MLNHSLKKGPRSYGTSAGKRVKLSGQPSNFSSAGDADQLPPVGPGGVLEAAIASGMIPVIDLRQIFRQAQESAIVSSAHAINCGHFPDFQLVPPHLLEVFHRISHVMTAR